MKSSRDPDANVTLLDAEIARLSQAGSGGIRFQSVRAALGWYFEMREVLKSPQSMHPRTQKAPNGAQVYVRVDGGKGGDFDEVLATMATIGSALNGLDRALPMGHRIILAIHRDGRSGQDMANELQASEAHVSRLRAKGEYFLMGALGVLTT